MKIKNLDYDARIPMDDVRAPISVKPMSTEMRPQEFSDYVPNNAERAAIAEQRSERSRFESPNQESINLIAGTDYIAPDQMSQMRAASKDEIRSIAKSMWEEQAPYREKYEAAKALVEGATEDAKANPEPELVEAMEVLRGRRPMTKEQVKEYASTRVMESMYARISAHKQ